MRRRNEESQDAEGKEEEELEVQREQRRDGMRMKEK